MKYKFLSTLVRYADNVESMLHKWDDEIKAKGHKNVKLVDTITGDGRICFLYSYTPGKKAVGQESRAKAETAEASATGSAAQA